MKITRSINQPIREGLSWHELWDNHDNGLVACWENGRELSQKDPDKAQRAKNGELIRLGWVGGVSKKLEVDTFHGTLFYLARWQGLRNDDLNIDVDADTFLECTKTGQIAKYNSTYVTQNEALPDDEVLI
jgi:hypothetical protein